MRSLLTSISRLYTLVRHDPLRRYIYLFLWPWFIPVVCYLIFEDALLADFPSFLSGLVVLVVLSTVANEADTYAMKQIIHRYPAIQHTVRRLIWMVVAFNIVNLLLAELSLRVFDATHFLEYRYNPDTNKWTMIFVFISGVVAAGLVESGYAFTQWKTNQIDRQSLEQDNLRIQLDALKSRINPHFLFNSLNSISALIADDPQRAEAIVDELSKVYRYMLQANRSPLVELGVEIRFIRSYVRLLDARYGQALQIDFWIDPASEAALLPPLSLQILIDHIIQHNTIMVLKPLRIQIKTLATDRLQIRHNCQPRTVLVDRQLPGIQDIAARYEWIGAKSVTVETSEQDCVIGLPLLSAGTIPTAFSSTQPKKNAIE